MSPQRECVPPTSSLFPFPSKSKANSQSRRYTTQAIVPHEPTIHNIFDTTTGTWQYIVADPSTKTAIIIDPVLDYDPSTQSLTSQNADTLLSLIRDQGYTIDKILETHAHADHLTAASYLATQLSHIQGHRPSICIGKRIESVQKLFGKRYGVPASEYENVFDTLFDDDEKFEIGNLVGKAIHLPGHTPDHLGYQIGDNVLCGDSLFHSDLGTARCDFPGGSPHDLYASAQKLLSLPEHTKIWYCHDYPPESRHDHPIPCTEVREHKDHNKHISERISEEEFVELRRKRDKALKEPRLLHQSLQINIRAGRLPKPSDGGLRLVHLPLRVRNARDKGEFW